MRRFPNREPRKPPSLEVDVLSSGALDTGQSGRETTSRNIALCRSAEDVPTCCLRAPVPVLYANTEKELRL